MRSASENQERQLAVKHLTSLDELFLRRSLQPWISRLTASSQTSDQEIYQAFNTQYLDDFTQLSEAGIAAEFDPVVEKFQCLPDRFEYYKAKTSSIEFVRNQKIQKIYFERKVELSEAAKLQFLFSLDYDSPQDKLRSFIIKSRDFLETARIQDRLRANKWLRIFTDHMADFWRTLFLLVTLVMCTIMLVDWTAEEEKDYLNAVQTGYVQPTFYVLGSLHLALSLIISTSFFFNHAREGLTLVALYYAILPLTSVAGLIFDYFYAFNLLHIIARNEILQEAAIKSLTKNGKALISMVILGFIFVFIASIIGFAFFRVNMPDDGCSSLGRCFATMLGQGMLQGGNIGEILVQEPEGYTYPGGHWKAMIIYEFLVWALLSVILMSLILGIIVDTFGQLREDRQKIEEEHENKCFICCLLNYKFDHLPGGFRAHTLKEHDTWSYFDYMYYLYCQGDSDDYNCNEIYLYNQWIVEKSIEAFPIFKALSLKQTSKDVNEQLEDLRSQNHELKQQFTLVQELLKAFVDNSKSERVSRSESMVSIPSSAQFRRSTTLDAGLTIPSFSNA